MKIQGTVALVTGANRGIGKAFVEELLDRGASRVYATARNPQTLEAITRLAPDRVKPWRLDVTKDSDIGDLAAQAKDVNLLVNNAGVLAFASLLDGDIELIRRDLETNYFGTLRMVRAFAPILKSNAPGAIVNLLSIVSLASMAGIGGYSASKAATFSLTQAIRTELAESNIAVHGVFPGPIDTDMARDLTLPKADTRDTVRCALDGVEADDEDIYPDVMSQEVGSTWSSNPKALERQFASM